MPQTGPDQKLSILAVVAHPHDISSMLGTLAHHIDRGDSVTAVAATGGYKLHREKLHDELGKPPEKRNKEIVPRATYDNVVLTPGDTIEVVSFVGGG